MKLIEVQVDRIVGPTHHYGGLGVGNVASQNNHGTESNPRAAAMQGLQKMRLVAGLGVPQIILPPQSRPDIPFLNQLGFTGSLESVLMRTAAEAPAILSAAMSSSAMWTANAATVSASVDGNRDCPQMTIANLSSSLHRAIEPDQTNKDLHQVFSEQVEVIRPVPGGAMMRDEGAANHLRLGSDEALPGIHIFVCGDGDPKPSGFWPRQTLAACQAIARQHGLPKENVFFLKQHPDAIDAGAFHNDVVAASHHHLVLHHELAFWDAEQAWQRIANRYFEIYGRELQREQVTSEQLSIDDAIKTYLFNSQIVSPGDSDRPLLICPSQVAEHAGARRVVDDWIAGGLFSDSHFMELRQSMAGGGGPACLRLRVPLTEEQWSRVDQKAVWTPELDESLSKVIRDQYPESLCLEDLCDASVVSRAMDTANAIKQLLH